MMRRRSERERDGGERLVDARPALAARHALERGAIAEVLVDAQLGIERHRLGQVAEASARGQRIGGDVDAADADAAGARRKVAGADAHRGGLAGAVGTEKAEHLARARLEADGVERGDATGVTHGQGGGAQHPILLARGRAQFALESATAARSVSRPVTR